MSIYDDNNDKRALSRAKRLRKHQERLRTLTPACFCGQDDPRCLELDHLLGQEFCDDDVPVCANHHRIRSDLQKDHPSKDADPREPLEKAGRLFHGLADYFELFEPLCREYGTMLCAEAAAQSPRLKRKDGDGDQSQAEDR
jgi:hypothetical protein